MKIRIAPVNLENNLHMAVRPEVFDAAFPWNDEGGVPRLVGSGVVGAARGGDACVLSRETHSSIGDIPENG